MFWGQIKSPDREESQSGRILQWGSRREAAVASELRCLFRLTIRAARSVRIPICGHAVSNKLTAFLCGFSGKLAGHCPSTGEFADKEAFSGLSKMLP
tara:strand:- start:724 stop:1014 length:291 start_codon:yes stop_codon:yes gene_type:complete